MEVPSFVRHTVNKKYPDLITPHKNTNKNYCGFYDRIDTRSHTPVYAKVRQLSVKNYNAPYGKFKRFKMTEWSPLLKSNGQVHYKWQRNKTGNIVVVETMARSLNRINKSGRYPIPNIKSFSAKLGNKQRFSKIYLISTYQQIKMHPADIAKPAITNPFG